MYGCESWTIKKAEHWRIDTFELWVGEDSWESLELQGDQASNPKGNQSWLFMEGLMLKLKSNTMATWCEELTHLKRPWCWERLKAGEGDNRGWDDWMASLTWWTWVWASSGSWWRTGKPGRLQSMGSQRGGHDWVRIELNWMKSRRNECGSIPTSTISS